MKSYKLLFTISFLLNYCLLNVLAENNYYIVSILRNKNDKYYEESEQIQNAIDKLVNDRMNDIYDMILENKDTYTTENGKIDEKLNELKITSQLRKQDGNKKTKFLFINNNIFNQNRSFNETSLVEGDNKEIEYIPIDSDLVSHICPILNYYAIRVYLSDVTLKKISNIPNVIYYEISSKDSDTTAFLTKKDVGNQYEMPLKRSNVIENKENSEKIYDTKKVLDETHWKDIDVQEIQFHKDNSDITINPLSVISQGQYIPSEGFYYDNNYYYPSSAGKDIDIYIVDTGLHTSFSPKDFDNYEGTPNERIISCDGNIYDGKFHSVNATEKYDCAANDMTEENEYYYHGTAVAIAAAGTINGSAKKANIHALPIVVNSESVLVAMDYIKRNGIPHKTVINFSFGVHPYSQTIQDKLNEMTKEGYIFIIGAGNRNVNVCTTTDDFATYDGFIAVGSININDYIDIDLINSSYTIEKSHFSDYGECLDIFAPGYIQINIFDTEELFTTRGTSFSSPFVAGVVATLISDKPEINYNFDLMKQTLIDLSLKDVIKGLKDNTPNRLINNGKRITFQHPKCNHPSGKYSCGDNGCCSIFGFCVDAETSDSSLKELCYTGNECQSEFGICFESNCNRENSVVKCTEEECCSDDGRCINRKYDYSNSCFIENGCISEFSGQCISSDLNNIDKYNKEDQEIILQYLCEKELEPYSDCICSEWADTDCKKFHEINCEEFLNSPLKYAPICEKLSDESKESYRFSFIDINSDDSKLNKETCMKKCPREDLDLEDIDDLSTESVNIEEDSDSDMDDIFN